MASQLSIVPYSERYQEAHSSFAARMWPLTQRRREENYLRWKFRGPARGEVQNLLLAVRDKTVVGQVGLIPAQIRVGSQTHQARWCCDLMVDPTAKSKWAGFKLGRDLLARRAVLLGSNPSANALRLASHLGARQLQGPRIEVLPVKLNHLLRIVLPPSLRFLTPFLAQIGRPVNLWRSRRLKFHRREAVRRVSWQELIPRIEARQKLLTQAHVVHDQDFLRWRFTNVPGFSAKSYALASAAGGYALMEEGCRFLYVLDWFAPHRDDFIALFQEVLHIALEAGRQSIQALAQDDQEHEWLADAGFLAFRRSYNILCHPYDAFADSGDKFSYCLYDSDGNL